MNELIIYILKVMAIHGLLYLFYRLVLRNTGHHAFNRGFLLVALIAAFCIPLIEIPVPHPEQTSEEISVIMWLSEPASGMEEFELVPVAGEVSSSYWHLLPWTYALIALILMARSIFYLSVLSKLKKHSEYIKKRWFKLFKISHDRPFSFFSNVFMPKSLFGTDAFDQILAHECEHVRQLHSIDRLIMDFVVSLFWFNPFIYLYRNALIEIHEFQADEVVLDRFNDPVGYQEILFSQLQAAQYSGLVSHFNFSMIKKRIVMMNKQRKMSGWVYVLTLPVTLMVVFAFSSKEAMEPLNNVGDEIASIIGPQGSLDWPELTLTEVTNEPQEPQGEIQENTPEILPLKSPEKARMTSGFGLRMHPIYKVKKMHKGMDFSCPTGTAIIATADGEVTAVKTFTGGYGKLITISHGEYQTRYAQLSEFKVKEGDNVKKGDVIGLSGSSGASTAPHLHYEVLQGDKHVDPAKFIKDYNFKASLEAEQMRAEETMLLAQQERELAEEALQKARQEEMMAHEERLAAEREAEMAERERALSSEMRENERQLEEERAAYEKQLIELQILNEKMKFEDEKQSATIRFDGKGESPLFVVDGEIVSEVSDLEPDDIARIEVLKGKSAKEKYGNGGKDGVIEITTKSKDKVKEKNKSKNKNKDKSKSKNKQAAFRVLIDPGHGGEDAGSKAINGLEEKQITLEVAKIVGNYFSDRKDIEVMFTRNEDAFLSLEDRAQASKNADLLISIHADSDRDTNLKHTSVYVDAENEFLQESLEVSQHLGGQLRAIDREAKVGVADLYLIRKTQCPAVLIEIGHLSNQTDLGYMTSPKGKEELAATIASAIEFSANNNW